MPTCIPSGISEQEKSDQLQLKRLNTEDRKLRLEKKEIIGKTNISDKEKQYLKEIRSKRRLINKKIKKIKKNNMIISEHAIIRYMERVKGIDIEEIKKEMVGEREKSIIKTLGDCCIPVEPTENKKGYKLKVRENVIVTILCYNKEE